MPVKKKRKSKKKNNLRARTENPGIKPNLNLKSRYEEIMDVLTYANTLPKKEKAWLNRFCEEWINANMKHGGPRLHKTAAQRKLCFDKNNARNACMYNRAKASGNTVVFSQIKEGDNKQDELDDIIEKLDTKSNYLSWEDESEDES